MSRNTSLIVAFLLMCLAQGGLSQSTNTTVTSDSMEYYLLQAFAAPSPRLRLKLNHIGLLTARDNGVYVVTNVLDGYPAQLAGLQRGDRLDNVDGEAFHPLWSFNARDRAGSGFIPDSTSRQIEFSRNGNSQSVRVNPIYENLYDSYRTARMNSPQQFNSGNKVIGYMKLWSLSRSTDDMTAFRSLVDSLSLCDGLILDLRDSYGFINAEHLDQFFPSRNSYFEIEGEFKDTWHEVQSAGSDNDYFGKAIVVIQNEGTRGGMELFAYQLSKLQRAISLGGTTAGKLGDVITGSQADIVSYRPASTTRVDGMSPENKGFSPEQTTDYSLGESTAIDAQFEAAVMTLMAIM